MYDRYSFILEWEELDEDLRQDKIAEYMDKCGEEDITEDEAEDFIKARFPIYF